MSSLKCMILTMNIDFLVLFLSTRATPSVVNPGKPIWLSTLFQKECRAIDMLGIFLDFMGSSRKLLLILSLASRDLIGRIDTECISK